MKRKKSFYDIVAATLLLFDVDWEDEFELLEVDDIFWDNSEWQKITSTTDTTPSREKVLYVS